MSSSEKINSLLEKGILLSPDLIDETLSEEKIEELKSNEAVIQKKNPENNEKSVSDLTNSAKVKVVHSYNKKSHKRQIQDFVKLFNLRFKGLEKFIKQRPEMQGLTSINRVVQKDERDNVSIIGMVSSKTITKNDNILLTLEDLTGKISVLIHKNNKDIHEIAKDLVLDEVIGVVGSVGKNIIFSNNLIFPDVSLNKEMKKAPEESYAVFISDLHIGSNFFLEKEFNKFLNWINGKTGTKEQKVMAEKTKYIFICGDLVEGVGIYPGQEEDLKFTDIKEQYKILADYLKTISLDKKIIISPGNHDAGRIAEPQPPIYHDFAGPLWELPNVILVSNPATVNIGSNEDFSGLDVLLYHGYSLIYYANNVQSIRNLGGQKRVDLLMKFLLQKRHLAPTHESNMYIPDAEEDSLIIEKVPDVFVTGHIHRATASQYRNVTLLNTSCWGEITEDQEKRGLEPQPARVFVMNLQSRKIKMINFFR
ncbi:metallophosphoesterase [Bacteroidota bacterium]